MWRGRSRWPWRGSASSTPTTSGWTRAWTGNTPRSKSSTLKVASLLCHARCKCHHRLISIFISFSDIRITNCKFFHTAMTGLFLSHVSNAVADRNVFTDIGNRVTYSRTVVQFLLFVIDTSGKTIILLKGCSLWKTAIALGCLSPIIAAD